MPVSIAYVHNGYAYERTFFYFCFCPAMGRSNTSWSGKGRNLRYPKKLFICVDLLRVLRRDGYG